MEQKQTVDLVRVPREEQYYDRDELFGRDASSVFPSAAKQAAAEKAQVAAAASRFISETELEGMAAERSAAAESAAANSKPLAVILAENKAKKEEAFQDVWKSMKQGKNRPLEEDELQFVNAVEEAERKRELSRREAEQRDLEEYQEARRQQPESPEKHNGHEQAIRQASEKATSSQPAEERRKPLGPQPLEAPAAKEPPKRAPSRPLIKIVKAPARKPVKEQPAKRQKTQDMSGAGLPGLVAYGSDSDSE